MMPGDLVICDGYYALVLTSVPDGIAEVLLANGLRVDAAVADLTPLGLGPERAPEPPANFVEVLPLPRGGRPR